VQRAAPEPVVVVQVCEAWTARRAAAMAARAVVQEGSLAGHRRELQQVWITVDLCKARLRDLVRELALRGLICGHAFHGFGALAYAPYAFGVIRSPIRAREHRP